MKFMYAAVAVLCASTLGGMCVPTSEDGTGKAPTAVAVVGATIVPMDSERLLEDYTVIVEGDRIVSVGPSDNIQVPAGVTVIQGAGRFVIPGLAELHGHIPSLNADEYLEDVLFLYVANGVTTVRGMLGRGGHLELRDRIDANQILGPSLYLAGPSFNGNTVRTPDDAEKRVRRQVAQGWDLLKIHPGVPRDAYDRMAQVAQELGIRFAGHVPEDVGLLRALEARQQTFDHLDGFIEYLNGAEREVTDEELRAVARMTMEAESWVVPTMAFWETMLGVPDVDVLMSYPELRYVPQDRVRSWLNRYREISTGADRAAAQHLKETRMRLLRVMQEEGVGILFGTDAPQMFSVPGFSIHREAEAMSEAGLTPFEIMVSATRNAGEYLSDWDNFGTIKVGSRADLVLLTSNPLEDISNLRAVEGVVVRGRWLSAKEISDGLNRIEWSYR